MKNTSITKAKKSALQLAKELCYSESVIKKIMNAKTAAEIEQILISARIG